MANALVGAERGAAYLDQQRSVAVSTRESNRLRPRPLPAALAPVPAFNLALLPDALRPWIADITDRVQCPPDFVAVGAMVAASAVLGCKLTIRPQRHSDWTETANIWGGIVGRPGALKSPALKAAMAPLERLNAKALVAHQAAMKAYQGDTLANELRADVAQKSARDLLKKNPAADVRYLLDGEDIEAPILKRYVTSSATTAALGELMRQNPNGLMVHRDELVGLLRPLEQPEQAEERAFYLTAWNGLGGFTVDRIGRGLNLHIPNVCLSLLGATQPGKLAHFVRGAVSGGESDDGLLQRFSMLVWPDAGGEWRNVDRWPDTDAKRQALTAFDHLDMLDPVAIGAGQDTDMDGNPDGQPYLRLDGAAHAVFVEWRTALEWELRQGTLHPALESHFAKYRKLVPSLALLCHLLDGGRGEVSEAAMVRALAWSEYLRPHAVRVYLSGGTATRDAALNIWRRLRANDLPHVNLNARAVYRKQWSGLSDRELVHDALEMLADHDWLICETLATAGREATVYHANPEALKHGDLP